MCGIAGIWDFFAPIQAETLDRFTDSLAHRGPDGRGTFIDGGLGLGHRRLSILDLSPAGANPMAYGMNGPRYQITYNGEVYNFLEIRAELMAKGYRFKSDTDTEVVVAAYAAWGPACLTRFNGMWAFAIWDSEEQKLFLARDRFGVKPLYVHTVPGRIAFASEIKAFLELDGFIPDMNRDIAAKMAVAAPDCEGAEIETIMAGVKRLPPGHTLTIDRDGNAKLEQWWSSAEHLPSVPARYEEQVEAFREIFFDAVRIRLRSDVAVGTCLSGGVDSSSDGARGWRRRARV